MVTQKTLVIPVRLNLIQRLYHVTIIIQQETYVSIQDKNSYKFSDK